MQQVGKLNAAVNHASVNEQPENDATERSLFYLNCTISKRCSKFLVDTGSALTIVPLQLAGDIEPASIKLIAANNSQIHAYGYSTLKIVIKPLNCEYIWRCVVADVTTPLLGGDFLGHFDLSINMHRKTLQDNVSKRFAVCTSTERNAIYPLFAVSSDTPANIVELLRDFPTITQPFEGGNSVSHNTRHYIETTGPPVACKPRPLHGNKYEAAKEEYEKLEDIGIVRKSGSPWSSPIHLVPKGDKWRVCGDYRRLNNVTKKDSYPMNNIGELQCLLYDKKIFSNLDLVRGYNQIPMDENSIEKTAVNTPFGQYEYLRMPFGLCNASQTFQRFMNELFGQLPFVYVYIDDVLIFSNTKEEHLKHLRQVFEIMEKNGLRIGLEKCHFLKSTINFLGHEISASGLKPLTKSCKEIMEIDPLRTLSNCNVFLDSRIFTASTSDILQAWHCHYIIV